MACEINSQYEGLQAVTDKRKVRGKRCSVATMLTLSVLAKVGGADTPEGMGEWVKWRATALRASSGFKEEEMPHTDLSTGLGPSHQRLSGAANVMRNH